MRKSMMALAGSMLALAAPAMAQEHFPNRPIQLIVPLASGGGLDIIARLLGAMVESDLGQKVIIVNKPGAGGAIGTEEMVRAKPDGYTIGGAANTTLTVNPNAFKVPFTPQSYTPIMQSDVEPIVFCVHKDFPADTGADFIKAIKAAPGKYTYGTDGAVGGVHLAGELISAPLGLSLRPVPYGGAGEEMSAFLSHSIDIYGGSLPAIQSYSQDGSAKCLLLSSAKPNAAVPKATGLAALGIPQAELLQWHGFIAPAGVPADRLRILTAAFQKAARSEKFRAFMQTQGGDVVAGDGPAFRAVIDAEYAKLGAVITRLGLAKKAP